MSAVPAYSLDSFSSPLKIVHSVYRKRKYRKHYSTLFPAEITVSTDPASNAGKTVFYLGGDAYTAPVALINGADHYLHRDHLGSILAISNGSGQVVEERQFTAWGAVEEFKKNGIVQEKFEDSILPRGFTGHEHFDQIKLIHMNGRMYDPQLKRFLSPDNNIQDPYDTRSYDRFSYVWHNPLMATDPSGEIIETIIAIVKIVGFIVAGHQVLRTAGAYATGYYTGWRPLASALLQIGLAVLNVGQAIGTTLFSSTSLTVGQTIATTAITGFATGVLGSVIARANIGDALKSGLFSAGVASAVAGLDALAGGGAGVKTNAGKKDRTKGAGRPKNKIRKLKRKYKTLPPEIGEITYQPDENGGFVPFNNSNNSSRKTVYLLREYRVTDWSMTFKGNAISIGQDLQQIGNPIAYAGYTLTLTGVGAPVGAPIAGWGNSISTTGSILESVGNQNWDNVGKSATIFGAEIGGKVLINRLPYKTQTSRTILRQGISFKANLIENRYVKN